jgi:hypothetical protein
MSDLDMTKVKLMEAKNIIESGHTVCTIGGHRLVNIFHQLLCELDGRVGALEKSGEANQCVARPTSPIDPMSVEAMLEHAHNGTLFRDNRTNRVSSIYAVKVYGKDRYFQREYNVQFDEGGLLVSRDELAKHFVCRGFVHNVDR